MAGEEVVVRGTVAGEPGTPVAGWVSLGGKQPQRWQAQRVVVTTDDGREVSIDELSAESIVPVRRREVAWRELEGTPIGALCERDAPAPDVEVDLRDALLRGGDPVVVWGEATDHGYVGGDSQRGSIERGVTTVRARIVAIGDDRDRELERARERRETQPPKPPNTVEEKRVAPYPGLSNRNGRNLPLAGALIGLAVTATFAVTDWSVIVLRAGCIFALMPIIFDGGLLPKFRHGRDAVTSLELLVVLFLLCGSVTVLLAYGYTVEPFPPEKAGVMRAFTVGLPCLALLSAAGIAHATRTRRRYTKIIARAPLHADPVPDGVWGKSIGRFSKEVVAVGETLTAGAGKNFTHSPFANVDDRAALLRPGMQTVEVALGEASMLTLTKRTREEGPKSRSHAELIDERTPVIAVGRARDGVLVKGGEASLLVFASYPDTDVERELAKLRRRDTISAAFAFVAVALLVASLVL